MAKLVVFVKARNSDVSGRSSYLAFKSANMRSFGLATQRLLVFAVPKGVDSAISYYNNRHGSGEDQRCFG